MPPSVLYIVWVWQEPHLRGRAAFRASVRAVHEEDSRLFVRASDVARFFAQRCRQLAHEDQADRDCEGSDPRA